MESALSNLAISYARRLRPSRVCNSVTSFVVSPLSVVRKPSISFSRRRVSLCSSRLFGGCASFRCALSGRGGAEGLWRDCPAPSRYEIKKSWAELMFFRVAERWRVYYNTRRPHSSLGYRPPAPAAWQAETKTGYGKVESKQPFPLSHTPDCGGELSNSLSALH